MMLSDNSPRTGGTALGLKSAESGQAIRRRTSRGDRSTEEDYRA